MTDFYHKPVLLDECIEYLNITPDGVFLDCTIGGAGHASEILKRLSVCGRLLGIDRDESAVIAARQRLEKVNSAARFDVVHANYLDIEKVCRDAGISKVNGILMDLGTSSHQLDETERGFSYKNDALLDMRMDLRDQLTADIVVNEYPEKELTRIITEYGEERWAARISNFIVDRRKVKRILTTGELTDVIKAAIPKQARREGPHPAKRVFQAIRIEVNDELTALRNTVKACADRLEINGRLCVISFHSLEDRIVKTTFKELSAACVCPKEAPVCVCNTAPKLTIISKKPILPDDTEVAENPRARSAKLRIAEKTVTQRGEFGASSK